MPRPIPVAVRQQIIQRREAGESLKVIAEGLEMAYESVRKVWRVYRREGRVEPQYAACGRRGVRASRRVYRAARWLKHLHPSWGAPLIRQIIIQKWPEEAVPHERSLQRWFALGGLKKKRLQGIHAKPTERGTTPHHVWEMDSREGMYLGDGQAVSWLLVSDEASGAVLGGKIFPPPPCL